MPWPTVVLTSVGLAVIGVLLVLKVEIANIIAAFSILGNVVGLLVYGKAVKIENNTNGMATKRDAMLSDQSDKRDILLADLVRYVKSSVPADAITTVLKKEE